MNKYKSDRLFIFIIKEMLNSLSSKLCEYFYFKSHIKILRDIIHIGYVNWPILPDQGAIYTISIFSNLHNFDIGIIKGIIYINDLRRIM